MAEISRTNLKVGENVSGQAQTIAVFTVKGSEPGPNVYIQANLHGAEIQGNAVIFELLNRLSELDIRGQITLVPQANPLGLNQKSGEYTLGRFDPVTGANWNRMYYHDLDFLPEFVEQHINADDATVRLHFAAKLSQRMSDAFHSPMGLKTGQNICYTLQQMAVEADYVLDLHTGPNSSKHLYVPEYARASAHYFNIPHVLFIPNEFDGALDEATFVPWWTLSQAFADKGRVLSIEREAFTLELGSQEAISFDEAKLDADSIMSYLSHKEVFANNPYQPKQMTRYGCMLEDYKTVYSPRGGLVEYKASHSEVIEAGQPLARILNIQRYGFDDVLTTISLPETVLPILHYSSGSVLQGAELYKVFYKYFEL
ncbi:MAG: succinylglutamate desuccinylase/aspartoacylase family protein [Algicola sp.]|nr:succinylglutamate desuccinylase/aspartoacylase family protein [Algicola sp.]